MKTITLWGPSSSGKTALLSLLYLRSNAIDSGWQIFPTAESLPEIIQQSNQISKDNQFPLGTKETDERDISYDFKSVATQEVFRLQTKDRAGVRAERMDGDLLASLVKADGIVLMIDHARGHRETEVINALSSIYVERTKTNKSVAARDPRPLAVCLSKVDRLIETPADLRRIEETPEDFVRGYISKELQRWIEQYHSAARYFPVSAAGVRLSYGIVEKSVFLDERLATRVTSQGTPINIVEPFTWLFNRLQKQP